jgi:hypothetical protein
MKIVNVEKLTVFCCKAFNILIRLINFADEDKKEY